MQRLPLGFLLFLLATFQPGWARAENDLACALPSDLTTPASPLTHVAAALATRNELNILALGSGSTVGNSGNSGGPGTAYKSPEGSFPKRMMDALRSTRPSPRFNLTVKGGRSMTAEIMLPILRQELIAHHYDLVLWQTGTVEAVQGLRPDVLRGVLQDGATAVEEAQADLVLIDPQFSRFLRANADLSPYETVLQQIASVPEVTLFHRFELTQTWVNNGEIDLERVSRDQRDKTIMLLNACLGNALARFVLTGAGEH